MSKSTPAEVTITPTGRRPIRFVGQEVAKVSDAFNAERRYTLSLYRTKSGQYVTTILMSMTEAQAFDLMTAVVSSTPAEVEHALLQYPPSQYDSFLQETYSLIRFRNLASQLLAAAPEDFVETVS